MAKILKPMAPGGVWMQISHQKEPEYVVHEAHIQRHLTEGGRIVDDPRSPEEEKPAPAPEPSENEKAMQTRIDQLEAMIKQLVDNQSKLAEATPEQVTENTDAKAKRSKA